MCGYGGLAWLSRLGTLGRLPVLGTPFRLGDRLLPGDWTAPGARCFERSVLVAGGLGGSGGCRWRLGMYCKPQFHISTALLITLAAMGFFMPNK